MSFFQRFAKVNPIRAQSLITDQIGLPNGFTDSLVKPLNMPGMELYKIVTNKGYFRVFPHTKVPSAQCYGTVSQSEQDTDLLKHISAQA